VLKAVFDRQTDQASLSLLKNQGGDPIADR
jgi:hypothetical protein